MNQILPCMKCLKLNGVPNFNIELQEYADNGVYTHICNHGHKNYTIDQAFKFEKLFDIAGYAYLDGYYRETIASSTSALERFYEFSIKVFLKKILEIENFAEYEITWKQVAKQSERQLGAYYFLYLLNYKKAPTTITNSKVNFRNSVIHNGKIPTKEEAYEYLEYIYEYIQKELKKMKENFNDDIQNVIFDEILLKRNEAKIPKDESVSTSVSSTLISLVHESESGLDNGLESLKNNKEIILNGIKNII